MSNNKLLNSLREQVSKSSNELGKSQEVLSKLKKQINLLKKSKIDIADLEVSKVTKNKNSTKYVQVEEYATKEFQEMESAYVMIQLCMTLN